MYNQKLKHHAYRMLGSVTDAEDVMQDAQIKLLEQSPAPKNTEAFMFKVVTNLSIDRLRRLKRERKTYFGPWLPEPIKTKDLADDLELAESLSMGFVLMLERLSPGERIVFILREGYDFSFDEIAQHLDIKVATGRQRYKRAKANMAGERRSHTPIEQQQELLEKLLSAVSSGKPENIVKLLSPTATALTDGGGIVSAAVTPITEPDRIAQVILFLSAKLEKNHRVRFETLALNMGVGLAVYADDELNSCIFLEVDNHLVEKIFVVRNPEKLASISQYH